MYTIRATRNNSTCFSPAQTFPLTFNCPSPCDFAIAPGVAYGTLNRTCGEAVVLTANCSGAGCGTGVSYSWSGNGISGSGSTVSFNAPNANGSYTYTVTTSKAGCADKPGTITLNVSGCGGGTFSSCIEAENGTGNRNVQSDANASGGQYVGGFGNGSEFMTYTFNLPTAGNYQLKLRYASAASPGPDLVVNGGAPQRFDLPTTGGWLVWADAPTRTLSLNAGNNTIRIQGGRENFALDKVCLEGGTTGTTSCNFAPATITANVPNPTCGQAITLQGGCNGADCGGVSYAWGNGISGSGASVAINVPNANGSYGYTLTLSKAGCANQTAAITLPVTGCGGNCAFTSGQFLFNWYGEDVYAHRSASGVLYVAYQDGVNGFKPRFWVEATQRLPGQEACFATTFPNARVASFTQEEVTDGDLSLQVSPNPNTGRFVVRFQTQAGQSARLRLSDVGGRSVQAAQTVMGTGRVHEETITLPAHVHGLLLLEVVSGPQRATRKVLIE